MHVGIINMHPHELRHYLPKALEFLGCKYSVFGFHENHLDTIRRSPITHWIFTGSEYNVFDETAPQLDLGILKLENKRFLLICYSMESVLLQLGCRLVKRRNNMREYFNLKLEGNTLKAYRDHYTYVVPDKMRRGIRLLATYKGYTMNAEYRNAVMTQWHPERTMDGIQFMQKWLE